MAVAAFYAFLMRGLTAHWCLLILVYPVVLLQARRLHDMGRSAWLLLIPGVLAVAAFAIWLRLVHVGAPFNALAQPAALVVGAGFALWCALGRGQAEANQAGMPATA